MFTGLHSILFYQRVSVLWSSHTLSDWYLVHIYVATGSWVLRQTASHIIQLWPPNIPWGWGHQGSAIVIAILLWQWWDLWVGWGTNGEEREGTGQKLGRKQGTLYTSPTTLKVGSSSTDSVPHAWTGRMGDWPCSAESKSSRGQLHWQSSWLNYYLLGCTAGHAHAHKSTCKNCQ